MGSSDVWLFEAIFVGSATVAPGLVRWAVQCLSRQAAKKGAREIRDTCLYVFPCSDAGFARDSKGETRDSCVSKAVGSA